MYRYLLFYLLIVFLPPASATDLYESLSPEPLDSSLGLDYNIGLENSKNYHANLDLVVGGDRHLQLGAGQSEVLTLTDRVNLYNLTLGYNSRYGAPFEYGLVYDYWGNTAVDASKLNVTSVNTTFYLSKRFSLTMEAGYIGAENSAPYNYFNLGTQIFF